MDRSKLKTYAPQARRDFIRAMTDRAAYFGLTPGKTVAITVTGEVAIIRGKAFPAAVAEKRKLLEERIERHGFEQTMEAMAYTWFNRLVAIRYMELHEYLDHGYRVLSNPDSTKSSPEIVEHAEHVDLPGLDRNKVIELKLDGTKESELYRMLLIAQCNALHTAMPFLFERIADETELLLPDNLLHSDSIIRRLVSEIDETDWEQVEIIGWLYQFYISEKKDEVIGSVVKSEDIPAATQLFTPNWIVKYLVQNSLGRQWLATYPQSPLKAAMEFYIEPAEQTPEVQAQLKAITPASLNPEELTLMDPASGSGHILVEGYELLKEIYLERGYRLRDIPKLILTKNLFGLEIDDRAAQLAAFALMMKARADDRRIFDGDVQPNVLAIQESNGLNVNAIVQAFTEKKITSDGDIVAGEFGFMGAVRAPLFATENRATVTVDEKLAADLKAVFALFENARTYGSLIYVPPQLSTRLLSLAQATHAAMSDSNVTIQRAAATAYLFISQAVLLAKRYDSVVMNPPYMGLKGMNPLLKKFADLHFPDAESDLFAMFIQRGFHFAADLGHNAMVTMQHWMFTTSYEKLRGEVLTLKTLCSVAHLGPRAFGSISGEVVTVAAFSCLNRHIAGFQPTFFRLTDGDEEAKATALRARSNSFSDVRHEDFQAIPGCPIAYWMSRGVQAVFQRFPPVGDVADVRAGLSTGDNAIFERDWHEVSLARIGFGYLQLADTEQDTVRWYPCNSGGTFRKWYGNNETVVDWENNGQRIRNFRNTSGKMRSAVRNESYYLREGVTWSKISTGIFGARYTPPGYLFDDTGRMAFARPAHLNTVLALFCSAIARDILPILAPSLSFTSREVASLPFNESLVEQVEGLAASAISIARDDWNSQETSWEFQVTALLKSGSLTTRDAFDRWSTECSQNVARMKEIEEANNRCFIEAYGLKADLSPEVPDDQITLYRADQREDIRRLNSYALGCAMGRYSLDRPGLIYANSGNDGFDLSQYKTFAADQDGIIPATEIDWFSDAAANRVVEFVGLAWPKEHLEENLMFIAESLSPDRSEEPRDTIRRYFANDFYKHHLQTYKRRPIYWLFTSGKQRAFQCLVYLHRYNEGTLSRMRTEYVIPLQGKIAARIETLEGDKAKATSTSHSKKIEKVQDTLRKQQQELLAYDEKLRHYADMRISLDLDDGVKVNYRKFADPSIGEIVADVKAVCGKDEED